MGQIPHSTERLSSYNDCYYVCVLCFSRERWMSFIRRCLSQQQARPSAQRWTHDLSMTVSLSASVSNLWLALWRSLCRVSDLWLALTHDLSMTVSLSAVYLTSDWPCEGLSASVCDLWLALTHDLSMTVSLSAVYVASWRYAHLVNDSMTEWNDLCIMTWFGTLYLHHTFLWSHLNWLNNKLFFTQNNIHYFILLQTGYYVASLSAIFYLYL